MARVAAAVVVLVASLVFILLRPRWLPNWAAAVGGGGLMLAVGALAPMAAVDVLVSAWNVFLFFLGLGLATTLGGLLLTFRADLPAPFEPPAEPVLLDRRVRVVGAGVGLLACVYVVAAAVDWPLGLVACAGSAGLLGLDLVTDPHWRPWPVVRAMPWGIFPLFAGLVLLVAGAEQVGVFDALLGFVHATAEIGASGPPAMLVAMAALANAVNNLPAALAAGSALGRLPPGPGRSELVAAAIVGVNLGPNLTTIGSLATMLWLLLLRRQGLNVSAVEYLRVGVAITLPALAMATLGIWVAGQWLAG